jgi:imidazoleglycerol-phosphate dehydratase/histidinol-phosphatase
MKKVLFIDRDGTLIKEPQDNYQVDSLDKLEYIPGVFEALSQIVKACDYVLVMVTNQDGLGTDVFPEEQFWPAQRELMRALKDRGIVFDDVMIDRSMPHENSPNRKPGTGLLTAYIQGPYDLKNSYVIGDRMSDMALAANLGAKGIQLGQSQAELSGLGAQSASASLNAKSSPQSAIALRAQSWHEISQFLLSQNT